MESTLGLSGRLCTVPGSKHALFESGDLESTSVVIFVGGLSDGLLSVGYVYGLAEALKEQKWSCVFVTLSSSFSQYGTSSLERDAREIGDAIKFLREKRGKDKIVLHGHSTGCQDAMQYLAVNNKSRPLISGAILQAPVSDYEFFNHYASSAVKQWVQTAEDLVKSGKGRELLPLEASIAVSFGAGNGVGAEDSDALAPPITPFSAYRFASLHGQGGDDDFFTSTIPDEKLLFASAAAPLLLFLGEKDGCYPPSLKPLDAKEELLQRWIKASDGKISSLSKILIGANHTVDDPDARTELFRTVLTFLNNL